LESISARCYGNKTIVAYCSIKILSLLKFHEPATRRH
jgi:hypothetical protein